MNYELRIRIAQGVIAVFLKTDPQRSFCRRSHICSCDHNKTKNQGARRPRNSNTDISETSRVLRENYSLINNNVTSDT